MSINGWPMWLMLQSLMRISRNHRHWYNGDKLFNDSKLTTGFFDENKV